MRDSVQGIAGAECGSLATLRLPAALSLAGCACSDLRAMGQAPTWNEAERGLRLTAASWPQVARLLEAASSIIFCRAHTPLHMMLAAL